jgi:hypothetical protein
LLAWISEEQRKRDVVCKKVALELFESAKHEVVLSERCTKVLWNETEHNVKWDAPCKCNLLCVEQCPVVAESAIAIDPENYRSGASRFRTFRG